jgi:hypothetical protein
MNAYEITVCPLCSKPIEVETTIVVHGSINYSTAMKLLKEGKSLEDVRELFCQRCGSFLDGVKKENCPCRKRE